MITYAEGYHEACLALGEAIVVQRLQARRIAELEAEHPSGFVDMPLDADAPPAPG